MYWRRPEAHGWQKLTSPRIAISEIGRADPHKAQVKFCSLACAGACGVIMIFWRGIDFNAVRMPEIHFFVRCKLNCSPCLIAEIDFARRTENVARCPDDFFVLVEAQIDARRLAAFVAPALRMDATSATRLAGLRAA